MPWLRLSDDVATHPKLLELTRAERWQWLELLTLAARHRTGGHVSAGMLRTADIRPKLLAALLELELLERDPAGELVLHDFERYNPPADPTNADRQRRWRERHRGEIRSDANRILPRETDQAPDVTTQEPRALEPERNALPVTDARYPRTRTHKTTPPTPPPDELELERRRASTGGRAGKLEPISTSAEDELERLRSLAGDAPAWPEERSKGDAAA